MSKIAALVMLMATTLTAGSALAQGRNCTDDFLQSNSDSGEILVMGSGSVFQVMAGDEVDAMLWLPATSLLLCSRDVTYKGKSYAVWTIINTDDNEKVDAFKLR